MNIMTNNRDRQVAKSRFLNKLACVYTKGRARRTAAVHVQSERYSGDALEHLLFVGKTPFSAEKFDSYKSFMKCMHCCKIEWFLDDCVPLVFLLAFLFCDS